MGRRLKKANPLRAALLLLVLTVLLAGGLTGQEGVTVVETDIPSGTEDEVPRQETAEPGVEQSDESPPVDDIRDRSTTELMRALIRGQYQKTRFAEVSSADDLLKYLVRKKWYLQKTMDELEREPAKKKELVRQGEGDLSALRDSASPELKNIIVILGEIPVEDRKGVFAPVFIADRKSIFGTRTDMTFTWVGLKATAKFTQKRFPWRNTTLEETLIGSFLYASGTNLGFISSEFGENTLFYTNYISQIVTLKYNFPYRINTAFSLDSRQYFFVEKSVPDNFVMPLNHYNIFPRVDLGLSAITEKGIDQLTHGLGISSWAGYGRRSRWEKWGTPPDFETGNRAQNFIIYSSTATAGYLINNNHNIVLRGRLKGGHNNDFLTRPRFGGTIDNAKLDVVHGFTVDSFRVDSYCIGNLMYGVNLARRLRLSLYFDYAHVFRPRREDVIGTAYGFRLLAFGGLPIWVTHGIGLKLYPETMKPEQVVMIMTAAGW